MSHWQNHQQHIMLSYEWTVQNLVLSTYDCLVAKELPVWMDIKAGIPSDNLFEGISEAIENSACFVCFMTPEYQQSDFCKQELQYAKACKIPIVPLKLVKNWEPTSWLGFITAGLLWLDFYHIKNLENKADELYNRICKTIGNQDQLHNPHASNSIENEQFVCTKLKPPHRTSSSSRQTSSNIQNKSQPPGLTPKQHRIKNSAYQSSYQTSNTYQMKNDSLQSETSNQHKFSYREPNPDTYEPFMWNFNNTSDTFPKRSDPPATVYLYTSHDRKRSKSRTRLPTAYHKEENDAKFHV
ncbi:unnamed protein product [Rotaria magnacalcarata]|uniref:TIR domain-containing protein n=1 Tax=Rotaria magnacalcarata TaxID=392030 RepID=A0A815D228_9BILA|nr:unnamed protein product [Rotaria magnacalcarata]CAF1686199.1 unnamed protein product [Rotaria magnacalcarata]CAF2057480.1 unnamed protein product [Rotaria magnacalcarata]CAF3822600.1 unnamed protein product [Rotaria magnacalcarata]CAF3854215.1 unnamed protein product [Rotaria magnacalcarata]